MGARVTGRREAQLRAPFTVDELKQAVEAMSQGAPGTAVVSARVDFPHPASREGTEVLVLTMESRLLPLGDATTTPTMLHTPKPGTR